VPHTIEAAARLRLLLTLAMQSELLPLEESMHGKGLGAHELLMVRLMGCAQSASTIAKQSSTAQRSLGARPGKVRPALTLIRPAATLMSLCKLRNSFLDTFAHRRGLRALLRACCSPWRCSRGFSRWRRACKARASARMSCSWCGSWAVRRAQKLLHTVAAWRSAASGHDPAGYDRPPPWYDRPPP
jgi:hypothetical protein